MSIYDYENFKMSDFKFDIGETSKEKFYISITVKCYKKNSKKASKTIIYTNKNGKANIIGENGNVSKEFAHEDFITFVSLYLKSAKNIVDAITIHDIRKMMK